MEGAGPETGRLVASRRRCRPPGSLDEVVHSNRVHHRRMVRMTVIVDLPESVLRRLQAEAARRGVPVESLIAETLERDFPPPGEAPARTLSFIGLAAARSDLGENYKQIRRDLAAGAAGDA